MAARTRLILLVLLAGLTLLGLAMGAESQREVFLESDLTAAQQAAQGSDSNLIVLTAVPTALGGAGAIGLLSKNRLRNRMGPMAALAGALYLLVNLAQGAWPNYNAYPDGRTADLANTLFYANLAASPSVLVVALGIGAGLLIAIFWATSKLLVAEGPRTPRPAMDLLRGQIGALALAAPFLIVATLGMLRLLMGLPGDVRGVGPYLVLLPAYMLICLALVATSLAKVWQLGVWVRNGRLAASVEESWQAIGRTEAVLAALFAALAVASSFLAQIPRPDLELGRTFSVTMRSHSQFLVFLLFALLPAARLHRRVHDSLTSAATHAATLESATHPLAVAAIACTAGGILLASLPTFFGGGALWAWLLASLPLAILAAVVAGPRASSLSALFFCLLLWGLGNTIVASYDGNQEGVLNYEVPVGVLALWRTLAVLLAGATLMRVAMVAGRGSIKNRLPLAATIGACFGAVPLVLMPLAAWLTPRAGTDAIAVGSLLASLDPAVRGSIHVIAIILSCGAALALAKLLRPEWFQTPRLPIAAVIRIKLRTTS